MGRAYAGACAIGAPQSHCPAQCMACPAWAQPASLHAARAQSIAGAMRRQALPASCSVRRSLLRAMLQPRAAGRHAAGSSAAGPSRCNGETGVPPWGRHWNCFTRTSPREKENATGLPQAMTWYSALLAQAVTWHGTGSLLHRSICDNPMTCQGFLTLRGTHCALPCSCSGSGDRKPGRGDHGVVEHRLTVDQVHGEQNLTSLHGMW